MLGNFQIALNVGQVRRNVSARSVEFLAELTNPIGAALRVLPLGVPLHAEAAAVQARNEVNTIGVGSLAAVLLLVWAAFGSLRPILLVALSLVVGMLAAVSATALVFGEVHLLTLVFGASLVGVAEDYGIHWFACRQGTHVPRWALLRSLLPGLALALATSALAYLVLGVLASFTFQVVYNITMSAGLAPVKGLTLPLMSYGGSSMIATLAGFGLILNVRMRRFTN